jgi:hypothetical protein
MVHDQHAALRLLGAYAGDKTFDLLAAHDARLEPPVPSPSAPEPAPIQLRQDRFIAELLDVRNEFVRHNQDALLAAVEMRDRMKGPIVLPQIFWHHTAARRVGKLRQEVTLHPDRETVCLFIGTP